MSALRVLVLCPGRGSYLKEDLGSLAGVVSPAVDRFEQLRRQAGRPSLREIDGAGRFDPNLHLRGEHASSLTAAISLADLEQISPDKAQVVGVCGNSMGWYTALGYAGALPMEDCARLIETMGAWQASDQHGVVGGQIVYPLVGEDWRMDPAARARVEQAVAEIPDLYWSIRLGGQAVLGGSEQALATAAQRLPPIVQGSLSFPLRLPFHSAFHPPLLAAAAERAEAELSDLDWGAPRLPLVDGAGQLWRPRWADPAALAAWTLGPQVVEPFDFSLMLKVALGELAPDAVVLPGPNSKLGGAVAQAMISLGWQGLRHKDDFVDRQRGPRPLLLAMRWPDQRRRLLAEA